MPRSRGFDEEEVVRAAREVFWERGYAATSLNQLEAATGLRRSSLYATFGSKRALFERATVSYLAEIIGPYIVAMEAPGAGTAAIAEFFLAQADAIRQPNARLARRGCLILNTAAEVDELDEAAATMVTAYRARVHAAITHALASVVSVQDPRARAEVLTAGHVGVMASARIDTAAAAAAAETIAADVLTW